VDEGARLMLDCSISSLLATDVLTTPVLLWPNSKAGRTSKQFSIGEDLKQEQFTLQPILTQ
jgi:hypothetical protein